MKNGIFYYQSPAPDYITCYDLKPFWYIIWQVSYFTQLIFPIGLAYQVVYSLVRWYRYVIGKSCNQAGWYITAENTFKVAISAVAFLSMWLDVAIFDEMRSQSHRFEGQSYMEDRWTYGQILTATTWLSIGIQFLRV